MEFPPARRGRRVDASPVDGSRVDGSRVVGSRVVGAPFPEEETEGERCGFDWRVGGRVQREHPRERDGAREFGGRRSPAREPGTQPGSRAPRFLHRGWRVALRRDARVRRRGDVSSPRVRRRRDARIALRKVSRRGGGVGVSLGPGRPSAREGDARHHPDTHDATTPTHTDATTPTRTPTARARPETETDSGLSAAKRKRDDARNVAAGSTSGAVLRASSVGGFHPIRRHRAHCPWIVVHADVDPTVATGGSLPAAPAGLRPGWLCVLDAVAPAGLGEDAGEPDVSGLPSASGEGGAGAAARGEGSPRRRGNSRTFPCTEGARRWRRTSRGTGEGREAFAGEPRETDRTREEDSKKSCHEVFLMLGTAARSARARPAETHVIPRIRHLVVTPRYDARDDGATHAHAVPRGDPFLGRVARARRRRAGSRGGAGAFRGDEIGTDRIARFEGRTRDRRSRGVVARRRRARGSDRGGTRVDGRLIPRGGGRLSR